MPDHPREPSDLPPPLMTSEEGSFAQRTIVERKPQIISQVIRDNNYPPSILRELDTFAKEIATQPMSHLSEQTPDASVWNQSLVLHEGKTWLEVPWYLAEAYFYRRLLEAIRYLELPPGERKDPFEKQKRRQERAAVEQLAPGWHGLATLIAGDPEAAFEPLLHSCLWGNRADLSNYTVKVQAQAGLGTGEERYNILIDHTDVTKRILTSGLQRVDFINDNVGMELFFDLALTDFLLVQGWVDKVFFHLKDNPFFVSDAMVRDVRRTVQLLGETPGISPLGEKLTTHIEAGRLVLKDSPFWTGPHMFRQMPPALRETLARADLVILKGDVNYRRLLDDRHWPYTGRMDEIAAYFPTPFLVLRTLKGEIMIGLQAGQAESLTAQDPAWMINGKRGIVQLVVHDDFINSRNAR